MWNLCTVILHNYHKGLADAGEASNSPENVQFYKTSNYFFELCATSALNRDQRGADLFDDLLVLQQ
jgi:hypothetical protein